jgi:hypothetical protein
VRKIVPRAAQTAKLSQRRTSKKQKVLQRSNPFVSETFVSFGLLAGAPASETDVEDRKADRSQLDISRKTKGFRFVSTSTEFD